MSTSQNDLILSALRAWIRQRPGLSFGDYGDASLYRSESRRITRQRHDAERLLDAAEMSGPHTNDAWRNAFRAFSGRLALHACSHGTTHAVVCGKNRKHTWCEECDPAPSALCHWCHGRGYSEAKPGGVSLNYTTGQYWPTEYRAAVCAVVASLLWANCRAALPKPDGYAVHASGTWTGDTWTKARRLAWYGHQDGAEASAKRHGEHAYVVETYGRGRMSAGDYLRAQFVNCFGRSLAGRWFR